jgi:hypothetical protein
MKVRLPFLRDSFQQTARGTTARPQAQLPRFRRPTSKRVVWMELMPMEIDDFL